jgi:hypothetical protein
VLRLAIEDARRGDLAARRWLMSDETGACVSGWPYLTVCAFLGLSPSWARAQAAAGALGSRGWRSMAGSGRGEVRPARRKVA